MAPRPEPLRLQEYVPKRCIELSGEQLDGLRRLVPSLRVTPSLDAGRWDLTPGADVGSVRLGDLDVHIAPKIGMERLLFLVSYSLNRLRWREDEVAFDQDADLVEVLLAAFARSLETALGRGVLRGYRVEEAALMTVRGRIDVNEQLRRRYGRMPPIEVRYDDYTEDIVVNQLLKAALVRCRRVRVRSDRLASLLRRFEFTLAEVSDVEFDARRLPEVTFNRLNAHYRPAVELARLILRSLSIEQGPRSGQLASAFLINMNAAFEDFVVVALREALHVDARIFPQGARGRRVRLDERERVKLEPDISWWDGKACRFVGDVKYKRVSAEGILHPDLYQLLAYTVALDLPAGLLIYATGEAEAVEHEVVHLGKRLRVEVLDASGSPSETLAEVARIAEVIRSMRELTSASTRAA